MVHWTPEEYQAYLKKMHSGAGKKPIAELTQKRIDNIRGKGNQGGQRMNKTEAEYIRLLEMKQQAGEIKSIHYNKLKFHVGGKRCWYSPDVLVVKSDGRMEIHEVKGDWVYEDARVKYNACAEKYDMFDWYFAQKKRKEGWIITKFQRG